MYQRSRPAPSEMKIVRPLPLRSGSDAHERNSFHHVTFYHTGWNTPAVRIEMDATYLLQGHDRASARGSSNRASEPTPSTCPCSPALPAIVITCANKSKTTVSSGAPGLVLDALPWLAGFSHPLALVVQFADGVVAVVRDVEIPRVAVHRDALRRVERRAPERPVVTSCGARPAGEQHLFPRARLPTGDLA